jgi:hypothetical protein
VLAREQLAIPVANPKPNKGRNMLTTQGKMVIAKALMITWQTLAFIIDRQLGYSILVFTLIFVLIPNNLKSEK